MHPAFSILFFTTLAGAAQGLVVLLALCALGRVPLAPNFVLMALEVAEVLLVAGLAASFLHLGRKMRAWRAVLMWRTSWMSREVIVLPAFIALVAVWWWSIRAFAKMPTPIATPLPSQWWWLLPALMIAGALVLWYCTAMIYACLRFIEEWAHPLTIINFTLIGLSSGMVLGCALAALAGDVVLIQSSGLSAIVITLVAWAMRGVSLRRNAGIKHKSTLQSATGIQSPKLVQKSMGMSAGAFNTREFFHGAKAATVKNVKVGFRCCVWVAGAADGVGPAKPHRAAVGAGDGRAGAWADCGAVVLFCAGQASAEFVLPGGVLTMQSQGISITGVNHHATSSAKEMHSDPAGMV